MFWATVPAAAVINRYRMFGPAPFQKEKPWQRDCGIKTKVPIILSPLRKRPEFSPTMCLRHTEK